MAALYSQAMPWEYWRVQFAERGICRWNEFDEMNMDDIQAIIAVWDGIAKAEQAKVKHGGNK